MRLRSILVVAMAWGCSALLACAPTVPVLEGCELPAWNELALSPDGSAALATRKRGGFAWHALPSGLRLADSRTFRDVDVLTNLGDQLAWITPESTLKALSIDGSKTQVPLVHLAGRITSLAMDRSGTYVATILSSSDQTRLQVLSTRPESKVVAEVDLPRADRHMLVGDSTLSILAIHSRGYGGGVSRLQVFRFEQDHLTRVHLVESEGVWLPVVAPGAIAYTDREWLRVVRVDGEVVESKGTRKARVRFAPGGEALMTSRTEGFPDLESETQRLQRLDPRTLAVEKTAVVTVPVFTEFMIDRAGNAHSIVMEEAGTLTIRPVPWDAD